MRTESRRSLIAACSGVLVALAGLSFAPRAQASCGDYVMVGGMHDPSHAVGSNESLPLGQSLPLHCPCNGPQCSQHPGNVPPPAPPQIELQKDPVTLALALQTPSVQQRVSDLADLGVGPPLYLAWGIFRPPCRA